MNDMQSWLAEMMPALFLGGTFLAAVLLGLAIPISIAAVSIVTRKLTPATRVAIILGTIIIGATLTTALSGRKLYSDAELALKPWLGYQNVQGYWGMTASRLCTIFVLFMACAELWRWATRQTRMESGVRWLWISVMAFFIASVGISGLFGTFRDPRLNDLYAPVVFTALALLARGCNADMWAKLRLVLLLPIAGSLVAMVLVPRQVLLHDYVSLLPGFNQRLYGFAEHANALGILAAAALMIELSPQVRARPSIIFLLCQLTVLVLAQSKTAWVAALVCIFFVRWQWATRRFFAGDRRQAALTLTIVGALVVAAGVLVVDSGARSEQLSRAFVSTGLSTFTGRTALWSMTLEEFVKSPIFGYGPSLLDPQYRYEKGVIWAGQAHNQFVQTLAQAGLLGMIALLGHLTLLTQATIKGWKSGKSLAGVLFILLLVRCFSESPLRMGNVMAFDTWLYFTVFVSAARCAVGFAPAPDVLHRGKELQDGYA